MPEIDAHIKRLLREDGIDFVKIFTDHPEIGSENNPLSTKRPQAIAEAAGFKETNELVTIRYSDKPRTVELEHGPHTYHNYYYDSASPAVDNGASASPAQIAGIETVPAGSGSQRYATNPDDAWRMALSTGAKIALDTIPLMPIDQRDFETQWRIAVAWAERIFFTERPQRPGLTQSPLDTRTYRDPGDEASAGVPRQPPPLAGGPGAYAEPDGPPPYNDADIPF